MHVFKKAVMEISANVCKTCVGVKKKHLFVVFETSFVECLLFLEKHEKTFIRKIRNALYTKTHSDLLLRSFISNVGLTVSQTVVGL